MLVTANSTWLNCPLIVPNDCPMSSRLKADTNYQGNFSDDQPPLHLGFRGEPLRGLVERALESGAISAGRARSILGIGPMEWLPFPRLGDAICGPSLTLEAHVQREAMRYLAERAPSLTAGPPELVRERGAWRVPVLVGGLGDPCPGLRGYLWMTAAGAVIDSELELGSPL